jgi:hypothetical protein
MKTGTTIVPFDFLVQYVSEKANISNEIVAGSFRIENRTPSTNGPYQTVSPWSVKQSGLSAIVASNYYGPIVVVFPESMQTSSWLHGLLNQPPSAIYADLFFDYKCDMIHDVRHMDVKYACAIHRKKMPQ